MSTTQLSFAEQRVYRRKDVPYFDFLDQFIDGLRDDFLKAHTDYQNKTKLIEGLELSRPPTEGATETILYGLSSPDAWSSAWLKYQTAHDAQEHFNIANIEKYPTAKKLIKEVLGSECGIALYSVTEPMSVIGRHTDPENRENKFIRIHIPLIMAKGDVFIEIGGEEADYSDIFGFNNQYMHSAHNYTKDRRLIFLIDIRREFLGLPSATWYSPDSEKATEPFKRNGVIWDSNAELDRLKLLQNI